jgi:hypothetical protein
LRTHFRSTPGQQLSCFGDAPTLEAVEQVANAEGLASLIARRYRAVRS